MEESSRPLRAPTVLRRLAVGAALLALAGCSGDDVSSPEPPRTDPTDVEDLARSFRAQHDAAGLVVGVVEPGGDRVVSLGVASRQDDTPVDGSTRFEIASVTKAFTGLLLADLAVRGRVALDDSLATLLPDTLSVPGYEGRPIRLRHLATHTSGLPRLPDNFHPSDPADPYRDYGQRELYAYLDAATLPRAPGARYAYSNLAVGLLGHGLGRREGQTYAELLQTRVLDPLGLSDTYVADADSADGRLALGYDGSEAVPHWIFDALAGAGAMRSTASDLMAFLEDQLDPDGTPLPEAIRLSRDVHHRADGDLEMGLGWHVDPTIGSGLAWHNGATAGFRSFLAFEPEAGVGVVILCNQAVALEDFDAFAFDVARKALELAGG